MKPPPKKLPVQDHSHDDPLEEHAVEGFVCRRCVPCERSPEEVDRFWQYKTMKGESE